MTKASVWWDGNRQEFYASIGEDRQIRVVHSWDSAREFIATFGVTGWEWPDGSYLRLVERLGKPPGDLEPLLGR